MMEQGEKGALIDADAERVLMDLAKESWLHARHLETQRLQFTSIYTVVVAATLTLIGERGVSEHRYLLVFLFALSIFGLMVVAKTNHEFGNHLHTVITIARKMHFGALLTRPTAYTKRKSIWKLLRIRHAFAGLYVATMLLLGWLFVFGR